MGRLYVTEIQIPVFIMPERTKKDKDLFNRFCFSYINVNFPELQPVTIDKTKQDPWESGGKLICVYKKGLSPKDKAEKRKATGKQGKK